MICRMNGDALCMTVEQMPMTVEACSFEAEYNCGDDFQNVKLVDVTMACEYDTDSPYLTASIGASLTANVDIFRPATKCSMSSGRMASPLPTRRHT